MSAKAKGELRLSFCGIIKLSRGVWTSCRQDFVSLVPGTTPKSQWQATIKGGVRISSEDKSRAGIIECRMLTRLSNKEKYSQPKRTVTNCEAVFLFYSTLCDKT